MDERPRQVALKQRNKLIIELGGKSVLGGLLESPETSKVIKRKARDTIKELTRSSSSSNVSILFDDIK